MSKKEAKDVVDNGNNTKKQTGKSKSKKPTKFPNLFYSPDYQQLFNKEIEEMTMELLQIAEVALSSYDYRTIDFVTDFNPRIEYDNFGQIVSTFARDSFLPYLPQTTVEQANILHDMASLVISPVKDALQLSPETKYSDILKNYGYYGSGADIIQYKPGYRADGTPYYDLEIAVIDPDGVIGYNIYKIEEG